MKAELHSRAGGYRRYIVFDETRVPMKFWRATHNVVTDRWHIENVRGRIPVNDSGRLGARIIAACEAEFKRIEREQ